MGLPQNQKGPGEVRVVRPRCSQQALGLLQLMCKAGPPDLRRAWDRHSKGWAAAQRDGAAADTLLCLASWLAHSHLLRSGKGPGPSQGGLHLWGGSLAPFQVTLSPDDDREG